jgi:prevent-host-death family protein
MIMRSVSAREANQQFSKILEEAVRGQEVVITRRGVPVAKVVQITKEEAAERERQRQEIIEGLRQGVALGPTVKWTRDELYEERLERPWRREE